MVSVVLVRTARTIFRAARSRLSLPFCPMAAATSFDTAPELCRCGLLPADHATCWGASRPTRRPAVQTGQRLSRRSAAVRQQDLDRVLDSGASGQSRPYRHALVGSPGRFSSMLDCDFEHYSVLPRFSVELNPPAHTAELRHLQD